MDMKLMDVLCELTRPSHEVVETVEEAAVAVVETVEDTAAAVAGMFKICAVGQIVF
jgi:hypothetical protein